MWKTVWPASAVGVEHRAEAAGVDAALLRDGGGAADQLADDLIVARR